MRPRKQILILGQSANAVSEHAFILSTALPVKVDRNLNPRSYTEALRAKHYDLIFLLDPGKGRDALIRLAPKGVPVLSTTDRRTESNTQLLETCKRLLSRKRGPISALSPVRVVAEVA